MTRRENGLWQQQLTVVENGRKKQKYFYGHTKQEVLRKIAAYKEQAANGPAFGDVAELWWEEAVESLAWNSLKNYRPNYERLKKYFSGVYIAQIRPSDLNRFMRDFTRKNHASDKTARNQLMVANLIFKYAVANGYLELNPAREITVPKDLKKSRREMPSGDDISRIKASVGLPFGLFAYMALYTGMRRGELLALTWEDVDTAAGEITISKSLYHEGNRPRVKAPKTAAGVRSVPIVAKLAEHLKPTTGPVFPGADGGYLTSSGFDRLWRQYVQASGITCTPHQLRHAYATMLFENGIAEADAQELLGHAQISTTMDIYTHIREGRKKQIRDKLLNVDI